MILIYCTIVAFSHFSVDNLVRNTLFLQSFTSKCYSEAHTSARGLFRTLAESHRHLLTTGKIRTGFHAGGTELRRFKKVNFYVPVGTLSTNMG